MNTNEFVERVAARSYLTRAEAYRAVEAVFAIIERAAVTGENVAINRFGKFKVASVAPRQGCHPRTGEWTHFQGSRRLTFRSASTLKERLNGIGEVPTRCDLRSTDFQIGYRRIVADIGLVP
ncbi:DNA-binding protein HU-beta [Hephaestia caeni]|uniref:DNA-binding protein HU-beta n=1 Tax=Hephaestia caeni TaxID=645617 RepID=A0A397PBL2_9SPHN|nr:HU family DNA-binding protein [Hephaestia caeni]RIA46338.1 DNA-binding protein HU-beta [Hephaestia caeni]